MRRLLPLMAIVLTCLTLSEASAQTDRQLLRGGVNGDVFLGCLSCSRFEADSVTNEGGTYGNEHGYASIHNPHGIYGSRYADTSVCNPYAQHPPRVVTERGTFMGYLTLNRQKQDAITQRGILRWLENDVCD